MASCAKKATLGKCSFPLPLCWPRLASTSHCNLVMWCSQAPHREWGPYNKGTSWHCGWATFLLPPQKCLQASHPFRGGAQHHICRAVSKQAIGHHAHNVVDLFFELNRTHNVQALNVEDDVAVISDKTCTVLGAATQGG